MEEGSRFNNERDPSLNTAEKICELAGDGSLGPAIKNAPMAALVPNDPSPMTDLCFLPSSFTDEELEHHLRSLFGRFGTISSTKAARDKKQRPFCFVQFKGVVGSEVFSQAHYLGGRSLRVERSRVRSNEIAATSINSGSSNSSLRTTPIPFDYFHNHPNYNNNHHHQSNRHLQHNNGHYNFMDTGRWMSPLFDVNAAMMMGMPAMVPWMLKVSGFAEVHATRKALFYRFKKYGYIIGIEIQWDPEGRKTASIIFDNPNSAHAALKDHDGLELWGGTLRCVTVPADDIAAAAYGGFTSIPFPIPPSTSNIMLGSNAAAMAGEWYAATNPYPIPNNLDHWGLYSGGAQNNNNSNNHHHHHHHSIPGEREDGEGTGVISNAKESHGNNHHTNAGALQRS